MKWFIQRLALVSATLMSASLVAADTRAAHLHEKIRELKQQDAVLASTDDAGESFLKTRAPWLYNKLQYAKSYLEKGPVTGYLVAPSHEQVSVQFSHAWAGKGFDGSGVSVDPASVAMGKSGVCIKDLFVASNLLYNDHATVVRSVSDPIPLGSNRRHFLHLLAGQPINFVSSSTQQECLLSYERLFLNNTVRLQVQVPLVRREHTLSLSPDSEISRVNRAALAEASAQNNPLIRSALGDMRPSDAPVFYDKYSSMEDFLGQTLDSIGIEYQKKQEAMGLGNVVCDVSLQRPLRYVDDFRLGARITFGTGRAASGLSLWQPSTGTSATVIDLSLHSAWHRGAMINPYIDMSLGYSFPYQAARRIPFALSYDGASHDGARMMEAYSRSIPFSELITLGNVSFGRVPETQVSAFSSTAQNVLVRNGMSFKFAVGNSCEQCFGKPFSLTFGYEFAASQSESYSGINEHHAYATEVATANTHRIGHRLLLGAGYRLNALCSIDGGLLYQFAGRNTEAQVRLGGGVALHF